MIGHRPRGTRERWNRRYASGDTHGTAVPNQFLVEEVSHLAPGAALDLACGAGRNAVWLAERGWRVTAVDFSDVALDIGRALAEARGVTVEWIEADVLAWTPPARAFDLVCVLYLQLPADQRRGVFQRAAAAVARGGTMLVVGHDALNLTEGWGGPTEPEVLLTPEGVSAEIAPLRIERAARVRRAVEDGGAARAAIDTLVRARRVA